MLEYYINNELTDLVKNSKIFNSLNDQEHVRLYDEICNATLHGIDSKIVKLAKENHIIQGNPTNSLLMSVIGICTEMPSDYIKVKNEGSYPDIDSDYSKLQRDKVIEYTKEKYGSDKVTQVVTFGTLGAKGAVRSSARALGYTVAEGDHVAKMIANLPSITIDEAIEGSDSLKQIIETKEEPYYHIINTAKKLEGLPNASGIHASAVVISDKPIYEYVPLMISKKDNGGISTQFEYKDVESNMLIKWDFLGLQTLDIINETVKLIKSTMGRTVDINSIDVDDPSIYRLLSNSFVNGVFQFESSIFQSFTSKVKPSKVEDLSAITALMRPGCLINKIDQQYLNAKLGLDKYDYGLKDKKLINKVWEICNSTYGLLIYQEQTIACATMIAGFNEQDGDNFRRSIGKKDAKVMEQEKPKFVNGCVANGYDKADSEKLFDQLVIYSEYQFNAAHSMAYSYITAQTAWLSANYPLQFYTAMMSICSDNTDDVRKTIIACKERGLCVLPPSINKSKTGFEIVDDSIVFGLSAIKGVGKTVSNNIIKNRPKAGYKSFGHFIIRNVQYLNKKVLEAYTKAGVFFEFGYSKNTILNSIEYILDFISEYKNISTYDMIDILEIDFAYFIEACLIKYSDKPDSVYYEADAIGMYITKHPMEEYVIDETKINSIKNIKNVDSELGDIKCKVAGVVTGISVRKTKSKTNMCSFLFTDKENSIDVVVFPSVYEKFINQISEGRIIIVDGMSRMDGDDRVIYPKLISLYDGSQPGLMKKLSSLSVVPQKSEEEIIMCKVGKLQFRLEKK